MTIQKLLEGEFESDLKLIVMEILMLVTKLDDHFTIQIVAEYPNLPFEVVRLMDHVCPPLAFTSLKIAGNLLHCDDKGRGICKSVIEARFLGSFVLI